MLRRPVTLFLLAAAVLALFTVRPRSAGHAAGVGLAGTAVTAPVLSVRANHLVDQKGRVIHLTGVDRSGAEYACAEGWGVWDGPTDTDAAVKAMLTWHINAVRIPLNEDCWLGINGVRRRYSGANYRAAIADYVHRLETFGITPILNLHFAAPGTRIPDGQGPMADEDHAPAFWRSLAISFAHDHHTILDLFNEPYPDHSKDTAAAWRCVLKGGWCTGVSFKTAGMQQLVRVVRSAGATQPLMIAGPAHAGGLGRWLAYEPYDPLHRLVASVHIYEPRYAPCAASSCWAHEMDPLAARVPIVAGEIGSVNCTASSIVPLMDNMDAHGIGYLAWSWNVGHCTGPTLIRRYSSSYASGYLHPLPTRTYGQGFFHHLAALWQGSSQAHCGSWATPITATGDRPFCAALSR